MQLVRYKSLADLRADAQRWDDLWLRSEATLPVLRAETLAQWVEHFAPRRRFAAVVVESEDRLLAALPIVAGRGGVARVPGNCWSSAGELLLDTSADAPAAMGQLAAGLGKLPWPVIVAEGVNVETIAWRSLRGALDMRGLRTAGRRQFDVGLVDVGRDWAAYESTWSGNHRRAMRKSLRRLKSEGLVNMRRQCDFTPDEASETLRTFCGIEDKSWKGEAGTSILRTPGMFDFFDRQVRRLAETGEFEALFLELDGRPIAGDLGYAAKGVFHSHKIAFDPEYRNASPGQVLCYLQLPRYFADSSYRILDTLGVLSEANAKWATRSYTVSRVLLSTSRVWGNPLVLGYERLWPRLKRLWRREEAQPLAPCLHAKSTPPQREEGQQEEESLAEAK
ncbi:MAG: GNAT family N-acetyltransferase [Planctomycetes bacterium]|nr:GNAT family N-acetyltransferase [Planctomycetota bacterium]